MNNYMPQNGQSRRKGQTPGNMYNSLRLNQEERDEQTNYYKS